MSIPELSEAAWFISAVVGLLYLKSDLNGCLILLFSFLVWFHLWLSNKEEEGVIDCVLHHKRERERERERQQ